MRVIPTILRLRSRLSFQDWPSCRISLTQLNKFTSALANQRLIIRTKLQGNIRTKLLLCDRLSISGTKPTNFMNTNPEYRICQGRFLGWGSVTYSGYVG